MFNKQNRYIKFHIIISFVFALLWFLEFALNDSFIHGLSFFIPFLIVVCISVLTYFLDKKHHIAAVIISNLLNIPIILFVQILIPSLIWLYFIFSLTPGTIDDIREYKKALSEIDCKECIEHFPTEIPNNAQNPILYKNTHHLFGSEVITLRFDANEQYINEELNKYKYQKTLTPKNAPYDYAIGTAMNNPPIEEYKVYVIHQENEYKKAYGIGIKRNNILYFYSNPD